jgi:mRNA interferase HicA
MEKEFTVIIKNEGEWWINPDKNLRSAIPRHTEIVDVLAAKICKDLGVPNIKRVK